MNNKFLLVAVAIILSACGGGTGSSSSSSIETIPGAVVDTTKPVITLPMPLTIVAADGAGVLASNADIQTFLNAASASDNVDGNVAVSVNAPERFPLGEASVVFTAVDAAGNRSSENVLLTVIAETQSGNVIKGPLAAAKVFLDYDNDTIHDSDEPFSFTDTEGAYSLTEDLMAPASYNVVVVMQEQTIDSSTGESFAAVDVALKAAEGGSVVSPMTTVLSYIQSRHEGGASLTARDLSAVLGLPESVDILTFNQYAEGVNAADAIAVEVVAQKLFLSALSLTEAVQGAASSGDSVFPAELARDVALDGIASTLLELSRIRNGETSELLTSTEGVADFSDLQLLREMTNLVAEDMQSGAASQTLVNLGLSVDIDVVTYALGKAAETVALIAAVFDDLELTQVRSVDMAALSALKHVAAGEIFATASAALELQSGGGDLMQFDETPYLTLNSNVGLASARSAATQVAEQFLVAQVGLLDNDDDGLPDNCNASCLALGFFEDMDDDNDGIVDAADDFPLESGETIDSDLDGVGDNADPDDDNDGVDDLYDAFPFDPTESADSDGDGVGDNADSINTSGAFELQGGSVTLQDYDPSNQTVVSSESDVDIADGVVSADLRSTPLSLTNIKNGTGSSVGDYFEALLKFRLDSALPIGDGTGTVDLTVTTGADELRAENESQLYCQLQINWSSDGASASIIEPAQDVLLEVNKAGVKLSTTIGEFDIMSVAVDSATGDKAFEIKLLSALSEAVKTFGGLLDPLLVPRVLHVKVVTSLPLIDAHGLEVGEFNIVIRLDN